MDYLGRYSTNIHRVSGFSEISFRIFRLKFRILDEENSPPNDQRIISSFHHLPNRALQELQNVEYKLRDGGLLAAADYSTCSLWLFTYKDDMQETLEKTTLIFENFLIDEGGNISAAELTRNHLNFGSTINVGASPEEELDPDLQLAIQKLQTEKGQDFSADQELDFDVDPNELEYDEDLSETSEPPVRSAGEIYHHLLKSINGLYRWRLCHDHGFMPLNCVTFLFSIESPNLSADSGQFEYVMDSENNLPQLAGLHVQLTSSGDLYISLASFPLMEKSFSPKLLSSNVNCSLVRGMDVFLAPNGRVARFISLEKPTHDENKRLSHRRHRTTGSGILEWKNEVKRFLNCQGLGGFQISGWAKVQIASDENTCGVDCDHSSSNGIMSILWPVELCYCRQFGDINAIRDSLPWYHSTTDAANIDPFLAAEQFFARHKGDDAFTQDKDGKDPDIPALDQPQEIQPEAEMEISILDSTDLLKLHPSLDPQASSAIYPTPPDAAPARSQPSTSFHHSPITTPAASTSQPTDRLAPETHSPQAIGEIGDSGPAGEAFVAGSSLLSHLAVDETNYNDDLFEDINTTEADFSFFDEPANAQQGVNRMDVDKNVADVSSFDGLGDGHGDIKPALVQQTDDEAEYGDENYPISEARCNDVTKDLKSQSSTQAFDLSSTNDTPVTHDGNRGFVQPTFSAADNFLSPAETPKGPLVSDESVTNVRSTQQKDKNPLHQRASMFDAITFDNDILQRDQKYESNGYFSYEMGNPSDHKSISTGKDITTIPLIGFPDDDESTEGSQSPSGNESKSDGMNTDGSESASPEDVRKSEIYSASSDGLESGEEDEDEDICHELRTEVVDMDANAWFLEPPFFSPDFSVPQIDSENLIQVAQVLVHQISHSTLEMTLRGDHLSNLQLDVCLEDHLFTSMNDVMQQVSPKAVACTLQEYLSSKAGSSENEGSSSASPSITCTRMSPTPVRLKRAQSNLEILPSAIPFWQTFSLEPACGPKDVVAYCICPAAKRVVDGAKQFLERVGETYQNCHFGNHSFGQVNNYDDGFVLVDINDYDGNDLNWIMQQTDKACEELAKQISVSPTKVQTRMLYMINPFTGLSAYAYFCHAFIKFLEVYTKSRAKKRDEPEAWALQIVPMDLIIDLQAIILPMQSMYRQLAVEIYEKCPGSDIANYNALISYSSRPSILLAEPLPVQIPFSFDAQPPPSLLRENSCIHLAYSVSVDFRWIVATWTDNCGKSQITLPYCLQARSSTVRRPFSDIIQDMCDMTIDICRTRSGSWRVFVVKDSPMDLEEKALFTTFFHISKSELKLDLTLLTVDANPPLNLTPGPSYFDTSFLDAQIAALTPQTNILPSPDASGASGGAAAVVGTPGNSMPSVATPTNVNEQPFEIEPGTFLVDVYDEIYSLVLNCPLNDAKLPGVVNPALKSGYLIKRKGVHEMDGLVCMSVNIVYVHRYMESENADLDKLMDDVLKMYRGLNTLARTKGVSPRETGILPWHAEVARKAAIALMSTL